MLLGFLALAQVTLAIDTAAGQGSAQPLLQPVTTIDSSALLLRLGGQEGPLSSPAGERFELLSASGEQVQGGLGSSDEETLVVELAGGVFVPFAIDGLRELRHAQRAADLVLDRPSEGDRVWRVRGTGVERIDGALVGFAGDALVFEGAAVGEFQVAFSELAGLVVEGLGSPSTVKQTGTQVLVDLNDGSRLSGLFERLDAKSLKLMRRGSALELPTQLVAQLLPDDGRARWLSALRATKTDAARPFGDDAGMVWYPRMDRAIGGGLLRCAGERHARGVGMLSPSRVEYALDGSLTRLRGACGLDDSVLTTPLRPVARALVELDGKVVWDSGPLAAGAAPKALDVPLNGAKTLALVVVDHDGSFAGDRVDWLSLLLVR